MMNSLKDGKKIPRTMIKSFDDGTSRTDWDAKSTETVLDEGLVKEQH